MRCWIFATAIIAILCPCERASAARTSELIPRTTANQHGLCRKWFAHVQMDRTRSNVAHVVLHDGTLFIQTDRALIQAIDAETGQTLWANQIGNPNSPCLVPGVSADMVAIMNGSTLFVLSRHTGKLLWQKQVDGAPGGGAELSDDRVYVPMVNGKIVAYRLVPQEKPKIGGDEENGKKKLTTKEKKIKEIKRQKSFRLKPSGIESLMCQSYGRAFVQPMIVRENDSEELVAWATDRGFLFVGRIDRRRSKTFTVQYRLTTNGAIAAKPTMIGPDPNVGGKSGVIFVTSRDGFVRAILANDGAMFWRFSTGSPITRSAVVVGHQVFVPTQMGGMYCLDAKTGSQKWWTPNVVEFIAASKKRVYAVDKTGLLAVLDRSNGVRVDKMSMHNFAFKLSNPDTDRMYFVSKAGLVQCLHEIELTKPMQHADVKPVETKKSDAKKDAQKPKSAKKLKPDKDNPFGGGDANESKPSDDGDKKSDDNPFGN